MMNEKTINEQYAYIRTLLEEKRLKEALMQLESLLWQCPDWDLRTRLEQLQTSYKYMLEYMKQGANDPERWNLYQKMVSDTWGIADQSRLLILDLSLIHILQRSVCVRLTSRLPNQVRKWISAVISAVVKDVRSVNTPAG